MTSRTNVSGLENNAFGISGEGVRRCRLSVQPRARGVSTIWQASVTKRLGAGEGRQRPILRLPRRRAPRVIASSRQLPVPKMRVAVLPKMRVAERTRRSYSGRSPRQPITTLSSGALISENTRRDWFAAAQIPSQARVRAGARRSSAYFLKPAILASIVDAGIRF